jgi:hypothetical protein
MDNESALLKEALTVTPFTPSCDFRHKSFLKKRLETGWILLMRNGFSPGFEFWRERNLQKAETAQSSASRLF